MTRLSTVNNIHVTSVSNTSVFEIGDVHRIRAEANVFAIQRVRERFQGNEERPEILLPPAHLSASCISKTYETINLLPCIHVNQIKVTGVSVASNVLIGSACHLSYRVSTKHVRDFS
ncbi:spore germination protein PE [Bacillus ectoiniformans]|uniref:spore germination protein GerPE n=1 Tax=Bacillus ectoiniformans TaxID=1494429 RepID=UPI00195A6537|nr:spore germination protein GerPE [Bacillus ectoiniformans]MBM7647579.1 spore germination protein PE [Bacillus ectoiniformans]